MEKISINGGRKLKGTIDVQGSKNSALPILSASLICEGETVLHNCPDITDVDAAIKILIHLGCTVKREGHTLIINSEDIDDYRISDELMREMRSSIVFLGALIARCGKAELSYPGGCELGPRPIDLHISSLKKLGVSIDESHGNLICNCKDKIGECDIILPIPSVGATENIMLAATKSNGKTVIRNAAREPEIADLADFLNKAGAEIKGAGESVITIIGKKKLKGTEHTIIPDRIAAVTYMSAAAITGSRIELKRVTPSHIFPVIPVFTQSGCNVYTKSRSIIIESPEKLKSVGTVITGVYPGFPTDAQPAVMAMSIFSNGTSVFIENIFRNRYKQAEELIRLGASIKTEGRVAVVEGRNNLTGATVQSTDLRGGAALCVAGLGCSGITTVTDIHHIKRGYEDIVGNLASLNADIKYLQGNIDNL